MSFQKSSRAADRVVPVPCSPEPQAPHQLGWISGRLHREGAPSAFSLGLYLAPLLWLNTIKRTEVAKSHNCSDTYFQHSIGKNNQVSLHLLQSQLWLQSRHTQLTDFNSVQSIWPWDWVIIYKRDLVKCHTVDKKL